MPGLAETSAAYRKFFVLVLLLAGMVAIAMLPDDDAITLESIQPVESGQLTSADMQPFEKNAVNFLTKLNYWSETDRSDLPDACGLYEFPCLDKIGTCILQNLVETEEGKITPRTQVCSCFAKSYQAITEIPGHSDMQVQCPFHCVAAIFKIAARYVSTVNGPVGPVLHCNTVMNSLSIESFGNKNSVIDGSDEVDSMIMTSINETEVTEAAEAFRLQLNKARHELCSNFPTFSEAAKIIYAKSGLASEGTIEYRIELALGGETFYVRIAKLSKYHQLVNPVESRTYNDTENLLGRFRVMSTVPEPCSKEITHQLAVSASGPRLSQILAFRKVYNL